MRTFLLLALLAGVASADPAKERLDAAAKTYQLVEARWKAGADTLEHVYTWSIRWRDASADAVAAADAHLDRMVAVEKATGGMVSAGIAPTSDASAAAYFRAEAQLLDAKAHGK